MGIETEKEILYTLTKRIPDACDRIPNDKG